MSFVCQCIDGDFILFFYSNLCGSYGARDFFGEEWAVRAWLEIELRNYFFAHLTVGSCFRLLEECMVKHS